MRAGAEEIDMVINQGALKSRDYALVQEDIRKVVEAARPARVKVILETGALSQERRSSPSRCRKSPARPSSRPRRALVPGRHDRRRCADATLGRQRAWVKASGGVRTCGGCREDAGRGSQPNWRVRLGGDHRRLRTESGDTAPSDRGGPRQSASASAGRKGRPASEPSEIQRLLRQRLWQAALR